MIELSEISKIYEKRRQKVVALQNVTYTFENGNFYSIVGHSGSGKSTLISILGLLENPTSGEYKLLGQDVSKMTDDELSILRMKKIGFVFQGFYLDNTLKAYENVILPMLINKDIKIVDRYQKAKDLLIKLGLEDRINHFPNELSGGEQQRVAIARALANDPEIILADEPTGNLDEANEKLVFDILKQLANEGKCVIVVSHSNNVKNYSDVILELSQGKMR